MEKLQAAIEKARQQRNREGGAPQQAAPRPQGRQTDATEKVELQDTPEPREVWTDWSALPELRLHEGRARRNRIFLSPKSAEANYFDKLRTKILQRSRDHGWKRMVITSPSKSCGKTTIATNLAASFNRQKDRRMILMDCDMRRPEMARQLMHRGTRGMTDVLSRHASFEEAAVRLGQTVAISMNHSLHPNPSELFLQDQTADILDEIEATFAPDLMVFDTPPILAADDTMALMKHVDCVLIVIAAEETTTEELDTVEKEIAEVTNVMGVVLNKCRYTDGAQSYYTY